MDIDIRKKLNSTEKEVFKILLEVSKQYFNNTPVRIVGGWVRDKILGEESSDIDIMTVDVAGIDFARAVADYVGSKDPHLIKANPEKSKNIETAKAQVPLPSGETVEVDFAMARKEEYNDNSRIPVTTPGNAKDDAMRRDLTINCLFYNLQENKVEDFSGNGIKDLITKTIRTPKEPLKTFTEDPLRVFRTIRFASKYDGQIDQKTLDAINDPSIIDAIKTKLAKERIGVEFEKILKNPNPEKAISLLKQTNLFKMLLDESLVGTPYENKMNPLDWNQRNPNHELSLWDHTFQVVINTLDLYKDADSEKKVVMLLSALTHDLGKLANWIPIEKNEKHPEYGPYLTYKGHEDESAKISEILLKYLKLDKYVKPVAALAQNHMRAHSLERVDSKEKAMRKYIRQMGEAALDWMDVYQLSLADALSKKPEYDEDVYNRYNELRKRLEFALASMNQSNQKNETVVNGNEIIKYFDIKPGPIIKDIKEFLNDLQDENPQITKDEALLAIKNQFFNQMNDSVNNEELNENNNINIANRVKNHKMRKQAIECPKHLLYKKYSEIQDLIDEEKYFQAQNILNEDLLKDYPLDERIQRITSDLVFKFLSKGHKGIGLDVVNYVLANAERDFCDPVLNGNAFGILLILKSNIDEKAIKKMGEKCLKLSPSQTLHVLNQVPENIPYKELKKEILNKIQKES